jgi:hypothetical protein
MRRYASTCTATSLASRSTLRYCEIAGALMANSPTILAGG